MIRVSSVVMNGEGCDRMNEDDMMDDDMMDELNDTLYKKMRGLTKGEVNERMMDAESKCGFVLNNIQYRTRSDALHAFLKLGESDRVSIQCECLEWLMDTDADHRRDWIRTYTHYVVMDEGHMIVNDVFTSLKLAHVLGMRVDGLDRVDVVWDSDCM